jgi:hypothetical protein
LWKTFKDLFYKYPNKPDDELLPFHELEKKETKRLIKKEILATTKENLILFFEDNPEVLTEWLTKNFEEVHEKIKQYMIKEIDRESGWKESLQHFKWDLEQNLEDIENELEDAFIEEGLPC